MSDLRALAENELKHSREINKCAEVMGARDWCCSYHEGFEDALGVQSLEDAFGELDGLRSIITDLCTNDPRESECCGMSNLDTAKAAWTVDEHDGSCPYRRAVEYKESQP